VLSQAVPLDLADHLHDLGQVEHDEVNSHTAQLLQHRHAHSLLESFLAYSKVLMLLCPIANTYISAHGTPCDLSDMSKKSTGGAIALSVGCNVQQ